MILKYTEAFRELGYHLTAPRQDWSAASGSGICISLWRDEISGAAGSLSYDTGSRVRDEDVWRAKPGHKKRSEHVAEALKRYDGFFDAVLVRGITGQSVEDADPWFVEKRSNNKWRIVDFDPTTGHFKAEIQPFVPNR